MYSRSSVFAYIVGSYWLLFLIALVVERRMLENEKKKENERIANSGVTDPNKVKAD